jgi:ribonuclease HIII
MDGKIEQRVCIEFCVKLSKSTTKNLEMLRETFGEHSLSRATVFEWHSRPVECQMKMTNVQGDQAPANPQKMFKKIFENSSTKTVAENP